MAHEQEVTTLSNPVRRLLLATAVAVTAAVVPASPAAAVEVVPLVNRDAITIGVNQPGGVRPADPYPSTIEVTGASFPIAHVEVLLPNLTHGDAGDLDIQLVGPTGVAVRLMSDAGNQPVDNVTLRFSDGGTDIGFDEALTSTTYAPTGYTINGLPPDEWPPPAVDPPGSDLADFDGTNPVGTWSLFVIDDTADGATGSLPQGWSLELTVRSGACLNQPDDGFADVAADNVHEGAIDCLVAFGVAQGTSPTTFNPTGTTTREQMASFVARTIDLAGAVLDDDPPDAFSDDDGSTHEQRIDQLAAAGVIGGNGEEGDRYFGSQPMRRDHMASYLYNAFQAIIGEPLPNGPDAFNDDNGSEFEQEINALAVFGVVAGTGGGLYDPSGTVSRAQMGSFLARFLQILDDAGAIPG